jgi:hypothetical protein
MNPCIFICSYPNTDEKIDILKECISSVKKSGFPVVAFSNMTLPEEISSIVGECLIGKNEECKYKDFFTAEEIDKARNSSAYLSHFMPSEGELISYRSFGYGRGSTYHWAGLTQQVQIIKYSRQKEITHSLLLEGDVILGESDIFRIKEYFYLMGEKNLDFIVAMQNNFRHMSGNGWFTRIDYWEKVCSVMSAKDFLRSTYPSFSSEGYVVSRMIKSGGKGHLLVPATGSQIQENFPSTWTLIETKVQENTGVHSSTNLLFPETTKVGLSYSSDHNDQDPSNPLEYLPLGIGLNVKTDTPLFFIQNRYNGITVKHVKAKISIFNGDSLIFNSEYSLVPGGWAWSPVSHLRRNSHCTVDITVIDHDGNEFNFSDRFGSVGDSINMRDIILE